MIKNNIECGYESFKYDGSFCTNEAKYFTFNYVINSTTQYCEGCFTSCYHTIDIFKKINEARFLTKEQYMKFLVIKWVLKLNEYRLWYLFKMERAFSSKSGNISYKEK